MGRQGFGIHVAVLLLTVLMPIQAGAESSAPERFPESAASATESALVPSMMSSPVPVAQAPVASPSVSLLAASASEDVADRVISSGDVDYQMNANMEEEPAEPEADDFFAKASGEVEKRENGEFAGLTHPIDKFLRYFTHNKGRKRMELYLSRSGKYRGMMQEILAKYGLPEDLIYLALIESGFSPRAYSTAKAAGPWQFIAGTGRRYGLRIDWWADERRDAEKSTHAAASYLRDLYGMFDSWPLAAAAYNAGEGKISKAVARYKSDDFAELIRHRYLAQETKDYVPKMLAALTIAKEPEKYGFSDIEYEEPLDLQTVTVPGGTDLVEAARILEVSYEDLREWNPELRRFCTPPNQPEYSLRLSAEAASRAGERIEDIQEQAKVTFLQHNVRKKETLGGLAAKYGTSPAIIRELNGLKSDSLQRVSYLVIPVTGLSESDTVPGREIDPNAVMAARMQAEEGRRKVRGASASSRQPGKGASSVLVRSGQTLTGIAKENRVSLSALAKANGLSPETKVKAGTRLALPKQKPPEQKAQTISIQRKIRRTDTLEKTTRASGINAG